MTRLFDLFYQSILNDTEPPISYEEIRRVTRFMDEIFTYCSANEATEKPSIDELEPVTA